MDSVFSPLTSASLRHPFLTLFSACSLTVISSPCRDTFVIRSFIELLLSAHSPYPSLLQVTSFSCRYLALLFPASLFYVAFYFLLIVLLSFVLLCSLTLFFRLSCHFLSTLSLRSLCQILLVLWCFLFSYLLSPARPSLLTRCFPVP